MADFTAAQRKELAANGEARPDGSYPIRNQADLQNAAKDWARTGHNPDVKAWILTRAKALNVDPSTLPGLGDRSEMDVARRHMKARSSR